MLKLNYTGGHIPALDGLRGIAVLLVMAHHCLGFVVYPLNKAFDFGWTGVDLFFVLSGFLITGILLDTKSKPNYYKNFIGRRTLRIFPLYYFVLILFFVFIPKGGEFQYLVDNQVYFWTYTQNLLFAFEGWPPNYILNHFWSLAIEEQFYLIWPLIIWFSSRNQILKIALLGIIMSVVIRNYYLDFPFGYTFTLARIDTLLFGGIAAIAIRDHRAFLEKNVLYFFVLSTIGVLVVLGVSKSVSISAPLMIRAGYTLIAIFYTCILLLAFDLGPIGSRLKPILEWTGFSFLGKYSYGIYVYHWIIYRLIYSWLVDIAKYEWLATLMFFILTLIVSYLSFHLFEKRFLNLKKYFN